LKYVNKFLTAEFAEHTERKNFVEDKVLIELKVPKTFYKISKA